MLVAGTPLWKAEEDQVADVIDFLAAHVAELNEVSSKILFNFNVVALERWSWTSLLNALSRQKCFLYA